MSIILNSPSSFISATKSQHRPKEFPYTISSESKITSMIFSSPELSTSPKDKLLHIPVGYAKNECCPAIGCFFFLPELSSACI